jgi:hypothetical protein
MSMGAPIIPMPDVTGPIKTAYPVDKTVSLADVARKKAIQQAWAYYKGEFKPSLAIRRGAVDDNVVMNYCRNIVDKGATFLFGKEPRFSLETASPDAGEETSTPEPTEEEKYLDAAWKENKKMTLLAKIATQGGVSGHVFVKVLPPKTGKKYPRIILIDTLNVTVETAPDDVECVILYRIEYKKRVNGTDGFHRQDIVRATEDDPWEIRDYERDVRGTVWQPVGEVIEWPYDYPPMMDCQNLPMPNEFYGMSDLPGDILRLNENINFTASSIARILKHHANPKTWGRGFRANEVESNVDNFLIIPNDTAEVKNLEMHSDLGSSLAYLGELQVEMHEASRMPEIALGKVERLGAITGVALAVLHSPLLEKTEMKQGTYGDLLREINAALLELGDFGEKTTVISWPKMLPSDPLAERQAATLDKGLGVSTETIQGNLGFDPALEAKRTANEQMQAAYRTAVTNSILAGVQGQAGGQGAGDGAQAGVSPATKPGVQTGSDNPQRPQAPNPNGTQINPKAVIDSVAIEKYRTSPVSVPLTGK